MRRSIVLNLPRVLVFPDSTQPATFRVENSALVLFGIGVYT
jgi:hypothetical protein